MELDLKQKVLVAIYIEYQKDIPDMKNNINAKSLNIDSKAFFIAIEKLQTEGLIREASIVHGGNDPHPIMVFTDNVKMTLMGINYVEHKLNIEPTLSNIDKVKEINKNAGLWGLEQLKDFAAKVLVELLSKATGQQ